MASAHFYFNSFRGKQTKQLWGKKKILCKRQRNNKSSFIYLYFKHKSLKIVIAKENKQIIFIIINKRFLKINKIFNFRESFFSFMVYLMFKVNNKTNSS